MNLSTSYGHIKKPFFFLILAWLGPLYKMPTAIDKLVCDVQVKLFDWLVLGNAHFPVIVTIAEKINTTIIFHKLRPHQTLRRAAPRNIQ